MFKKIIKSKWAKLGITIILIYFAFKQVNINLIIKQLSEVKITYLIFWLIITALSTVLLAYRWSLLLIKKPSFWDILIFAKSIWSASFYGLFVPTSVGGDIFKWIIIDDKYPNISKSKLGGSILLDRFIGMSTLVFFGFVSQFFAISVGVKIPFLIKFSFWLIVAGCFLFYGLIFFEKTDLLFKNKWLEKIKNINELVDKENRKQIVKSLGVSIVSDFLWIWQMWMISQYFGSNLSFVDILVFLPVISTILILPISMAGFGAREQLYLYFFTRPINTPESILLTSTIAGIIGILNCLLGGLISLTPEFRNSRKILTFEK